MAPADLQAFLQGLLTAWSINGAALACSAIDGGVSGSISRAGSPTVHTRRMQAKFGIVWQVETEGARPRAHKSAQGAIRSLGAALAPERAVGRVMFIGPNDGAP